MSDEEVRGKDLAGVPDDRYESPAVFDLGTVVGVTMGNSGGSGDHDGQRQA